MNLVWFSFFFFFFQVDVVDISKCFIVRFERLGIPSLEEPIEEKYAQILHNFGKELETIFKVGRSDGRKSTDRMGYSYMSLHSVVK